MGEEAPAIAGRAFDDCDPFTGDHLEATVSWRGESDLEGLAGRPVRLRLRMRRARVHALWFT